jgi:DNA-binding response OmpR family regulator
MLLSSILLADDDLSSRLLLQSQLISFGYQVEVMADGLQTWERLNRPQPPSLLILDWMMPGFDGLELVKKVRLAFPSDLFYIILLTSRSDMADMVSGLDAGADDYIVKPFQSELLRARVQVGQRVLRLQHAVVQKEKLQGVLEMAGAVCHEMNQPLQSLLTLSELLLMMDLPEGEPREFLQQIQSETQRVGELTKRIMNVSRYRTKRYAGNRQIVDIERASETSG